MNFNFKKIQNDLIEYKEMIKLAKIKIFKRRTRDEEMGLKLGDDYVKDLVKNQMFKDAFEAAIRCLEFNYQTPEDIDAILKTAASHHEAAHPLTMTLEESLEIHQRNENSLA